MHLETDGPRPWASLAWVDKDCQKALKSMASQSFHSSASLPDRFDSLSLSSFLFFCFQSVGEKKKKKDYNKNHIEASSQAEIL